jgi:hypothetical protein
MSIDLVLYAANKAAIRDFAIARNILDADGNVRDGIDYCWWAGSGKLMTQAGTYDSEGTELTPPNFLPGVVMLMNINRSDDQIDEGQSEQWHKSKLARYIRNNADSTGTMGGITYYQKNGVRLFRAQDVFAWLAANNLPSHEWLGGNSVGVE